jgi:AcrR family transcriptional regulator
MAEIAREVGISKQALLHHFRNRDALYAAVVDEFHRSFDALLPELVTAFSARGSELEDLLHTLLDAVAEHIDLVRFALRNVLFAHGHTPSPAGRAMAALMLDYLRRGQDSGRFRKDFSPEPMLFNLGLMVLASMAAADYADPLRPERSVDDVRVERSRELIRIVRAALCLDE